MLRLKEIREKAGLKQKDVCSSLNIPQNTYSQYENNKREPDNYTLLQIAKCFNVSVEDLFEQECTANINISLPENLKSSKNPFSTKSSASTISERIKECREQHRLTQEQLGYKLGMDKSTIQRYENGIVKNIKTPILEAMAKIFNVSLDYLLCKTDIPNITNFETPNPILNKYNKLNTLGKTKAENYIDDLLENKKYTHEIIEMPREEYYQVAAHGADETEAILPPITEQTT